jgi:hypothetical protein
MIEVNVLKWCTFHKIYAQTTCGNLPGTYPYTYIGLSNACQNKIETYETLFFQKSARSAQSSLGVKFAYGGISYQQSGISKPKD